MPLAQKFLKSKPKQDSFPRVDVTQKIARKKARQNKKNGRWAIVALFLLTTFTCFFFYLKTEAPIIWKKITSPMVISTISDKDSSSVVDQIKTLVQDKQGTYGVYVYQFGDGGSYGFNHRKVFTAASLIKLPVMLAVYQESEKGNFNLTDYQSELEAMGKRSDNDAFKRVVKVLGEAKIQETIDSLGMVKTSFENNDTSPADVGLFFQKLYQGDLISKKHQEEFLDFLTDTSNEDRIPAGIPEGIRVAHKVGTETSVFSDAGIVYAEKPLVLVIMSGGARESEASEALPEIARAVLEFEE